MPGDTSKIGPNMICHVARTDHFSTQIRPRLNRSCSLKGRAGPRPDRGFVMSIEHPRHHKQVRSDGVRVAEHQNNVLPLHADNAPLQAGRPPHRDDAFLAALSPLLEEAAGLQGDESPQQETNDFLLLLEENARLRKLAVKLSNLLGDLPENARVQSSPGRRADVDDR